MSTASLSLATPDWATEDSGWEQELAGGPYMRTVDGPKNVAVRTPEEFESDFGTVAQIAWHKSGDDVSGSIALLASTPGDREVDMLLGCLTPDQARALAAALVTDADRVESALAVLS